MSCYQHTLKVHGRSEFEGEIIERWIKNGVLISWKEEVMSGVPLLMSEVQPTKGTVRSVLDFRKSREIQENLNKMFYGKTNTFAKQNKILKSE